MEDTPLELNDSSKVGFCNILLRQKNTQYGLQQHKITVPRTRFMVVAQGTQAQEQTTLVGKYQALYGN